MISFTGTLCEYRQPSKCDEAPCVHGRCILTESLDIFRCECQIGFTVISRNIHVQDALPNVAYHTVAKNHLETKAHFRIDFSFGILIVLYFFLKDMIALFVFLKIKNYDIIHEIRISHLCGQICILNIIYRDADG
uniref:EGF-like domain-containing protein n=1 Tax=Onchocerca volvulus TaxID=6282 RepID=A0A8R1TMH7_ONCVO